MLDKEKLIEEIVLGFLTPADHAKCEVSRCVLRHEKLMNISCLYAKLTYYEL